MKSEKHFLNIDWDGASGKMTNFNVGPVVVRLVLGAMGIVVMLVLGTLLVLTRQVPQSAGFAEVVRTVLPFVSFLGN